MRLCTICGIIFNCEGDCEVSLEKTGERSLFCNAHADLEKSLKNAHKGELFRFIALMFPAKGDVEPDATVEKVDHYRSSLYMLLRYWQPVLLNFSKFLYSSSCKHITDLILNETEFLKIFTNFTEKSRVNIRLIDTNLCVIKKDKNNEEVAVLYSFDWVQHNCLIKEHGLRFFRNQEKEPPLTLLEVSTLHFGNPSDRGPDARTVMHLLERSSSGWEAFFKYRKMHFHNMQNPPST
jgi:hypothetical protein